MSGEIEVDYCDICRKKTQVQRKYYHYNINCECCDGDHFEIVRHCKNCEPRPPKYISAIVVPKELQSQQGKINPEYWEYYA